MTIIITMAILILIRGQRMAILPLNACYRNQFARNFQCQLEMALNCQASAIIYKNTWVYGDYQLIIAINASTRQLTVQPIATSSVNAMFLS